MHVGSSLGLGEERLGGHGGGRQHMDPGRSCLQGPVVYTEAQRMAAIVEDLGQELSSQKSVAHFLTLSRVLPETLAATDLRQEFKRGSDSSIMLTIAMH